MTEFFVVIAASLAVIGNVPYLRDVLRGIVQPHPYTWFVGSIVTAVVFFGILDKGAGIGAIPVLVSEFFTVAIFVLSIKYGFKDIRHSDTIALLCALVGVVIWLITDDAMYAVALAVGIDLFSFIPTIRKTWVAPRTELPILYGANVVRHILIIASLGSYNFTTLAHSVAMIAVNGLMTVLSMRRVSSGTS